MKRSSVVITLVIVGGTALLLSTCHSCSSSSFPYSLLNFTRPAPQPVTIPPYAPGYGPSSLVDRSQYWNPPRTTWVPSPTFYGSMLSFVPYASAPPWVDPTRRDQARSSSGGYYRPGYSSGSHWGSSSSSSSSSGKSSGSSSSGVSRGGFGGSGHAAGGGGSS